MTIESTNDGSKDREEVIIWSGGADSTMLLTEKAQGADAVGEAVDCPMKVLFLDIDGVLNSHAWWERRERHTDPNKETRAEYAQNQIDPECVARLNVLLERTGAEVVISSSWRIIRSQEEIVAALQAQGFKGKVIGMTPDLGHKISQHLHSGVRRGTEIQAWLDKHSSSYAEHESEVDRFAIVDDDSDMAHLMDRLVLTSLFRGGLQDEHVELLVALLGEASDAV